MISWIDHRKNELQVRLRSLRNKKEFVVVQPYFRFEQELADTTVHYASSNCFSDPSFRCDIFFGQGNRPDVEKLATARQSGRAGICANWFWDNHHLYKDCMHIAMLTDIYFAGHNYASHYLQNELSIDGGFIPMLPISWTRREVEAAAISGILRSRLNLLYGGYNSYPEFSRRDELIKCIISLVGDNAIFLTSHSTPIEDHPFNRLSAVERLGEWMRYKVCLCASVDQDITMRMFDALLTGAIPLVVGRPKDLDIVIPREMQSVLPIIVVESKDPCEVVEAYKRSLIAFDEGGNNGVMTRHCYVRDNHMPEHRLSRMINRVRDFAERSENLNDLF